MTRLAAALSIVLFASPLAAQVCPNPFTTADYPSVRPAGRWTMAEAENWLNDNILALCENADEGGSGSPEGAQYHPDRVPASGLVTTSSDEFEDGFETTWRWANQGGATDTAALDTALLSTTGGGSANLRVRWVDAPAGGTDFTVTAKVTPSWNIVTGGSASARLCGLIVLVAGSEATPTALRTLHLREAGTGVLNIRHGTTTSYTTAPTAVEEQANTGALTLYGNFYLQLRYAQAAKVLTSYVSQDGLTWVALGTETLSTHPISLGRFVNSSEASGTAVLCRTMWYRTCTSAGCLAGEAGS